MPQIMIQLPMLLFDKSNLTSVQSNRLENFVVRLVMVFVLPNPLYHHLT